MDNFGVHASVDYRMTCLVGCQVEVGRPPKFARVSPAFAQCILFQRMDCLQFMLLDQKVTCPLALGYQKAATAAPAPKYFQTEHPRYQGNLSEPKTLKPERAASELLCRLLRMVLFAYLKC